MAGPADTLRFPGALGSVIGTVDDIGSGRVTAKGADGSIRVLEKGGAIYKNDVVETVGRSYVGLRMNDDTSFQMGKESRAILDNYEYTSAGEDGEPATGKFEATVVTGFFRYASGKLGGMGGKSAHSTIKTPTAQIGIRGSELQGQVEKDGSSVFVHQSGVLDVSDANGRGTVTLTTPGTATGVRMGGGAPDPVFEAPDSLVNSFSAVMPAVPAFAEAARVEAEESRIEAEEVAKEEGEGGKEEGEDGEVDEENSEEEGESEEGDIEEEGEGEEELLEEELLEDELEEQLEEVMENLDENEQEALEEMMDIFGGADEDVGTEDLMALFGGEDGFGDEGFEGEGGLNLFGGGDSEEGEGDQEFMNLFGGGGEEGNDINDQFSGEDGGDSDDEVFEAKTFMMDSFQDSFLDAMRGGYDDEDSAEDDEYQDPYEAAMDAYIDSLVDDYLDSLEDSDDDRDDDQEAAVTEEEEDEEEEVAEDDTTAPTAIVIQETVGSSDNATVQSSELGVAYLVNSNITVNNLTDITGSDDDQWNSVTITVVDTNTDLSASGLVDGTYKVYTADISGNLSNSSSNTLTVETDNGLVFDGVNDYITLGDVLNDPFGVDSNEFKLEVTLTPTSLASSLTNHNVGNVFFAKASDPDNDNIEVGINTDGQLLLYIDAASNDPSAVTMGVAGDIVIGSENVISVHYNDGIVTTVINGATYTDDTTWNLGGSRSIDTASGSPVTIGASLHVDTYFTGAIKLVKIYDSDNLVSSYNFTGNSPSFNDLTGSNDGTHVVDPIVIDLDGDGIEMVQSVSTNQFSMTSDGTATPTNWLSGDDGFLALDINNNGKIDNITELFSEYFAEGINTGLGALSTLDENSDGIIDQNDSQFINLQVWQDFNQDGISSADELKSLAEHSIEFFDLNVTKTNESLLDSTLLSNGTVTMSDSSNRVFSEVAFAVESKIASSEEMNTILVADSIDLNAILIGGAKNIEKINMQGHGDDILTLKVEDLLDITDINNILFVDGDTDDQVIIESGWKQQAQNDHTHHGYHQYSMEGVEAALYIDDDINKLVMNS